MTIFFELVQTITKTHSEALTEGLENWTLHGVHYYEKIGGVCLAMQYSSKVAKGNSEVGVTVDIIPVKLVYPEWHLYDCLNDRAEMYLSHSLFDYVKQGDIYRLLNSGDEDYDMGIVENRIMKELPENKKLPFRIVKFFLQNTIDPSDVSPSMDIENIEKETSLKLYGCKPHISSYAVRLFFLHLLMHVHGTDAEEMLKDGTLIFCLLDMLHRFRKHYEEDFADDYLNHPLIYLNTYHYTIHIPDHMLDHIISQLETENVEDMVEGLSLLNYPRNLK